VFPKGIVPLSRGLAMLSPEVVSQSRPLLSTCSTTLDMSNDLPPRASLSLRRRAGRRRFRKAQLAKTPGRPLSQRLRRVQFDFLCGTHFGATRTEYDRLDACLLVTVARCDVASVRIVDLCAFEVFGPSGVVF
jgi:hypothetical protein